MKVVLYGLFDVESSLYDHQVFTFVDERVAYSSIRRSLREGLINKSLSEDWISEHHYTYLGELDTQTGEIKREDRNESEKKHWVIDCFECVYDLVEE